VKLVNILRIKLYNEFNSGKNSLILENKKLTSIEEEREYNLIEKFDINWSDYYLINKIDDISMYPISHYINNWRTQNLIIDNFFDTYYYLNRYPDIKNANINPLIHYFMHGIKEGRKGIENDNR